MQLFTNLNNKQNSISYLTNDPNYVFWIMSSANFSMKKALMFSGIFFFFTNLIQDSTCLLPSHITFFINKNYVYSYIYI